jgi:hypothetical protein
MIQEKTQRAITEMRHLVGDYVRFRVWFDFYNGKRRHMLGQEWGTITLAQLINRRVPQIKLDREAGYKDCIGLCEKFHGRYRTAKIYSGYKGQFDKVHRIYTDKDREPEDIQDPVIDPEKRFFIIDYHLNSIGEWELSMAKSDVVEEIKTIDFKKEVEQHLQPSIPGEKIKKTRTKKVKAATIIK